VKITVKYPHESNALELCRIVEDCATLLVGEEGQMGVWDDLGAVDMGRTQYSRQCLKVDRKTPA
jgi:hypothetical protein